MYILLSQGKSVEYLCGMKKKLRFTLLILLISCSSVLGQRDFRSGYIISLENDTLEGWVDYRSNLQNYGSCLFKSERGEVEYTPSQIKGFGYINDKFFSSQIVDGSFVEVLVVGQLSLYKSRDYYLFQKNSELFEIKSKMVEIELAGETRVKETSHWRGLTSYLVSDCLTNTNDLVSNLKLEEQSLARIVVRYNKCTGSDFKEFKSIKPWAKIDYGVAVGIASSTIKTNAGGSFSYLDKSYSSVDPTIGLLLTISSPRVSEKFSIQTELHFIKSSYSALTEVSGSFTEYHDTFINFQTVSFPFSLKYSLAEKKYGGYLQGGASYEYHISSEAKLMSERVTGSVVDTYPDRQAFEINKSHIGYWGGVGLLKPFSRFKGNVTLRYFYIPVLSKAEGFSASYSRVSINLVVSKK